MPSSAPGPPRASRALARGTVKRCPRCGGGRLFDGWFRLKERCPTCGYRFKREEGFFTGVFLVNFATALALMWVFLIAYFVWRAAADSDGPLWPALAASLGIALLTPVVFYPFATTIWAALDLLMRPLEPSEIAEADAAVGRR